MQLRDIIPFLGIILVLAALVGAVGGIVYLVLKLRAGERITFPTRLLFRLYLYVISLISLVTLVAGLSNLVQAGLGAALGKEFSYNPVYVAEPFRPAPEPVKGEPPTVDPKADEELRQKGLDRALKEGLLNGLSLSIVGAAVLALHTWSRRRLETEEERRGIPHRVYLILLLALFGVVTLVTLPSAIYESLRYYLLDTTRQDYGNRPGGALATALVALPVWAYYLRGAIGMLRKGNGD
ncbi:MAG: hypothetical protein HY533_03145 [Chloroflexi bacterium]|nr:hypothetical protein [Chloroflexota bacterium]